MGEEIENWVSILNSETANQWMDRCINDYWRINFYMVSKNKKLVIIGRYVLSVVVFKVHIEQL